MQGKTPMVGVTGITTDQNAGPITAGKHRRSYYVAITQATQNGTTTVEEIRLLPKELYTPDRMDRVHDCSAYDAAISNLCREDDGFRLTIDRGPGGFQIDLPPTMQELAKVQELLPNLSIDQLLKQQIAQDLAKQAVAAASGAKA